MSAAMPKAGRRLPTLALAERQDGGPGGQTAAVLMLLYIRRRLAVRPSRPPSSAAAAADYESHESWLATALSEETKSYAAGHRRKTMAKASKPAAFFRKHRCRALRHACEHHSLHRHRHGVATPRVFFRPWRAGDVHTPLLLLATAYRAVFLWEEKAVVPYMAFREYGPESQPLLTSHAITLVWIVGAWQPVCIPLDFGGGDSFGLRRLPFCGRLFRCLLRA